MKSPRQDDRGVLSPVLVGLRLALAFVFGVVLCSHPTNVLADEGGWEFQPYRVRAVLAIDAPGGLAEQLADELPRYLHQRVHSVLTPAWQFEVQLAAGVQRAEVAHQLSNDAATKPADLVAERDKLLVLRVLWTPTGFELAAREYDALLQRWGVTLRHACRQHTAVAEQLFALLRDAFAPLAQFDVDPADPQAVKLTFRGAALPRRAEAGPWCRPGDVLAPLLRRTSRGGQVADGGITPVPWTYLEAVEGKDKSLTYRIRSGSRRPFPIRRQARVEQLAIRLPLADDPTTLYLHARKSDDKPLVGYEVLAEIGHPASTTLLGLTNAAGEIPITGSQARITTLQIKHGNQLLAKLPVVPGAERRLSIPLPDDDARLTAEMRLAAVREDLIDVVARRNILMARARQKIEKKDYNTAEQLLRSLDDLPGNPQFNLTLTTAARLIRSDDPQVQRRIDQLFKATQLLTTKFLDLKPINQLHDELRAARQKPAEKSNST